MDIQLLPAHTATDCHAAATAAAVRLAAGELVAFPTETVYGLGADADQAAAVARIFAAKGRPSDHPLIVHLAAGAAAGEVDGAPLGAGFGAPHGELSGAGRDVGAGFTLPGTSTTPTPTLAGDAAEAAIAAADRYAAALPTVAERLMRACWPGPLTLILPRRAGSAAAAAGQQASIGLRCPDHGVAQALLRAAAAQGVHGVAAPSANRFGRVSPTQAAHVREEFEALDARQLWPADPRLQRLLVLDGGACRVGIESAILDLTRGRPVLLRPGLWSADELAEWAGEAVHDADAAAPRASGTLAAHYAPRTPVRLGSRAEIEAWLQARQASGAAAPSAAPLADPDGTGARLALYCRAPVSGPGLLARAMPASPAAVAHELFAVLRELDARGVEAIWIEQAPPGAAWAGVRDRLQRAAAAHPSPPLES